MARLALSILFLVFSAAWAVPQGRRGGGGAGTQSGCSRAEEMRTTNCMEAAERKYDQTERRLLALPQNDATGELWVRAFCEWYFEHAMRCPANLWGCLNPEWRRGWMDFIRSTVNEAEREIRAEDGLQNFDFESWCRF